MVDNNVVCIVIPQYLFEYYQVYRKLLYYSSSSDLIYKIERLNFILRPISTKNTCFCLYIEFLWLNLKMFLNK